MIIVMTTGKKVSTIINSRKVTVEIAKSNKRNNCNNKTNGRDRPI